jgi:hypothetical protein
MKTPVTLFTLLLLIAGTIMTDSCTKENAAGGIDKELFDLAQQTGGFTWYKFSDTLLDMSSGSGHSQPFLRTRYNSVAASQLDTSGKILTVAVFPEGSLVVKELYDDPNTLARYAILYKKPADSNADVNGWIWGYIDADGTVAEPASNQGSACISCHSQSGNIEYMLMNLYFP